MPGPDGNPVFGLSRRASDGRWRVIGTDITFTEPNKYRAIARFLSMQRGEEPAHWLRFGALKMVRAPDFGETNGLALLMKQAAQENGGQPGVGFRRSDIQRSSVWCFDAEEVEGRSLVVGRT